ncbi:hypothetical protein PENTCL1PPCAC_15820, partial [Pristionchus entomophagus]
DNENLSYNTDSKVQYSRASAARLDGVPVSLGTGDIAAVRSCNVNHSYLGSPNLVGALALVAVDVSLDASSGAVVVVGASLPGSVERISCLLSGLSAVLVVGRLDLIVSTGERADVHVAADGLAARLLVADALEAVGGKRLTDERSKNDENLHDWR